MKSMATTRQRGGKEGEESVEGEESEERKRARQE